MGISSRRHKLFELSITYEPTIIEQQKGKQYEIVPLKMGILA